jgi:hypothetical protein
VVFYWALKITTLKIRPGRIFLESLASIAVLDFLFPQIHAFRYLFLIPIVYGVWFIVVNLNAYQRKKLIAERKDQRRKRVQLKEGLLPSEQGIAILKKPRIFPQISEGSRDREARIKYIQKSPPWLRFLIEFYRYLVVIGLNYALFLSVQAMIPSPAVRTRYAAYLLVLIYPAVLYVVLAFPIRVGMKAGSIFVASLLSILILSIFFPSNTVLGVLWFPTVCFGLGILISLIKEHRRHRIQIMSGADPRELEPELEDQREIKRRIERKFRSKRENIRWYRHPWYSR